MAKEHLVPSPQVAHRPTGQVTAVLGSVLLLKGLRAAAQYQATDLLRWMLKFLSFVLSTCFSFS